MTQVLAAARRVRFIAVEDTVGRTMSHEYVDRVRNEGPLACKLRASRQVEAPITELRLPRRPPDPKSVYIATAVLQVDDTLRYELTGSFGLTLEAPVMVAGDHDFVRVWLSLQKPDPASSLLKRATAAAVARMNQHVTVRDLEVVEAMRVADEDEPGVVAHPPSISCSPGRVQRYRNRRSQTVGSGAFGGRAQPGTGWLPVSWLRPGLSLPHSGSMRAVPTNTDSERQVTLEAIADCFAAGVIDAADQDGLGRAIALALALAYEAGRAREAGRPVDLARVPGDPSGIRARELREIRGSFLHVGMQGAAAVRGLALAMLVSYEAGREREQGAPQA